MKKTIGKPENWQDFESLCKKLWGEIWCIPEKIKKNGRLGQEQAGVDVYGIPKNHNNYWGIQVKGKDDYTNAKLNENEINAEIEKAKKFKPELEVYIIATTQNKDAKIEQYVRLKDIENRKNGAFEILLYCWEDIVDLLEENQLVYNWYLNGINQKGKFDFKISFNKFEETLVLRPILEKKIIYYRKLNDLTKESILDIADKHRKLLHSLNLPQIPFNKVNKSWCSFDIIMENTGTTVIEDWKLVIKFIEGVHKLHDGTFLMPKISKTESIDNETKTITYHPRNNEPLIQKDNKYFNLELLPSINSEKIIMHWELLARDFSRKEIVEIKIEPEFIEEIDFKSTENGKKTESDVLISYHVVEN